MADATATYTEEDLEDDIATLMESDLIEIELDDRGELHLYPRGWGTNEQQKG